MAANEVTTRGDRWRELAWDVGPVLALFLVGVLTVGEDRPKDAAAQYLLLVPLVARRLWPIPVLVVVGLLAGVSVVDTPTPWVHVGAVALAAAAVGERSADRLRGAL